MGRKARRTSAFPEELKGENDGEDRISKLPDDIVVEILSLLTVREALSTSVLSHRWRYMWTFISNLDFDALKTLHGLELRQKYPIGERSKYRKWVNQVLNSHQALTIDRFRVRFDLDWLDGHNIYKWIEFAIQKRVKRLELDLSTCKGGIQFLRCSLRCFPSQPLGFLGYDSLKALQLSSINVTGEFLEYFLSMCQLLERLSVVASEFLVNLKVAGPALWLKYLEISCCLHLEKIEIYAENLTSLKYSGSNINLPLQNIPQLTELFVGGGYCMFLIDNISEFSCHLSQLETLGLDMHGIEKTMDFLHFPILSHLKQLEVKLDARDDESLLGLTSLIKASPFLQRFALKLCCYPEVQRDVQKVEKCCHEYLEVVEFYGFIGRAIDLELATYFIENAVALEKIIFDRRNQHFPESARELKENRRKIARKHARLLGKKLCRGVKIVIL